MIKIPEQFSVGFHTWKNDKIPVQVIDNKPINGFKLLTIIKRNSR